VYKFVIKSIFYSSLDFGISKYNYGSEKTPAGSLVIGIPDVIIALMWFFLVANRGYECSFQV